MDDENDEGEDLVCPFCGGTGLDDQDGMDCPECDGTGVDAT